MKILIRCQPLVFCTALTLSLALSGCSTPPDKVIVLPVLGSVDKVILLPDPGGKVGAVIVRSATEEQTINSAYAGVDVTKEGAMTMTRGSEASVQAQYGELLAARPPRPMSFTVNFVFNSATEFAPESSATVAELKAALANWPAPQVMVIAHTDRVGSEESNDGLSMLRAKTVSAFLVRNGIPAQHIDTSGRGEREPLVATADGVAHLLNRRVVITIQ